eukprot:TRINITY_DN19163_c0_g1_i1.p1 TRINITY_DN19163_c0_g1~~TRINITY_DN19163_c0_g1_i1.p1  ORF type:complete len:594 (-),score=105.48 TRINITY_DN19163_c0_g1_i1:45-1826(-)
MDAGYGRPLGPHGVSRPTRIDQFNPPRSSGQANFCSLGQGLAASFGCGLGKDEALEIEVDRLDRQALGAEVERPPEFTGGLDGALSGDFGDEAEEDLQPGVYNTTAQPLLGEVLRRGQMWMLSEADVVERGELMLYANGVCFRRDSSQWGGSQGGSSSSTTEAILTPFAFVRPVAKQSAALQEAISPLPYAKMFAVTFYLEGRTLFFGVTGGDETKATSTCMRWVRDLGLSIRWVTESLFTRGSCFQAAPGPPRARGGLGCGCDRIMAGYLLQSENSGEIVRVVFVEIHPPREGKAWMFLYDEGACSTSPWQEALIDARTPCYEKVGHDCSCFCVGGLQLSARTVFERQLWLKAAANLKVKLQSRGPEPRPEELAQWRESINDHINDNVSKLRNRVWAPKIGSNIGIDGALRIETRAGPGREGGGESSLGNLIEAASARDGGGEGSLSSLGEEMKDLANVAERLRGVPLLTRCVPHSIPLPQADSEVPRPGESKSPGPGPMTPSYRADGTSIADNTSAPPTVATPTSAAGATSSGGPATMAPHASASPRTNNLGSAVVASPASSQAIGLLRQGLPSMFNSSPRSSERGPVNGI